MHGLQLTTEALHEEGPICPGAWAVLCSFHVVRGAEAACALASNYIISEGHLTEQWSLPISKTDPTANGCVREWGCVCGNDNTIACPFHAALILHTELMCRFGTNGILPHNLPLFPNSSGGWCTRNGFVKTVEAIALRLGLPLLDQLGRRAYGEHVWRISSSRHLSRLEIPVPIIMKVARWGSNVVLRYLGDAPLQTRTATYIKNREMLCRRAASAVRMQALTEQECTTHPLDLDDHEPEEDLAFIQHKQTRRIHIVSSSAAEFLGLEDLVCLCKWQATLPNVIISAEKPAGDICKDCLKVASRLGVRISGI